MSHFHFRNGRWRMMDDDAGSSKRQVALEWFFLDSKFLSPCTFYVGAYTSTVLLVFNLVPRIFWLYWSNSSQRFLSFLTCTDGVVHVKKDKKCWGRVCILRRDKCNGYNVGKPIIHTIMPGFRASILPLTHIHSPPVELRSQGIWWFWIKMPWERGYLTRLPVSIKAMQVTVVDY